MSVVLEYIARNYIYDIEYKVIKIPIFGGEFARALILSRSSFQHRAFLMFRQKWFLLLCVMQSEPIRTENQRLRLPKKSRQILRLGLERIYDTYGFGREAEWRLLDAIRAGIEPRQAEAIANSLGSVDIHVVDGLSMLLGRAEFIRRHDNPENFDLAFEIATFAQLGSVFELADQFAPQASELLVPYMQFKYGLFFSHLKYPFFTLETAIQNQLSAKRAIEFGAQAELALRGLKYLDFEGLPSAFSQFSRPQRI